MPKSQIDKVEITYDENNRNLFIFNMSNGSLPILYLTRYIIKSSKLLGF